MRFSIFVIHRLYMLGNVCSIFIYEGLYSLKKFFTWNRGKVFFRIEIPSILTEIIMYEGTFTYKVNVSQSLWRLISWYFIKLFLSHCYSWNHWKILFRHFFKSSCTDIRIFFCKNYTKFFGISERFDRYLNWSLLKS